jgi:hypothetical protein
MYRNMGFITELIEPELIYPAVNAVFDQPTGSGPAVQPSLQTICK